MHRIGKSLRLPELSEDARYVKHGGRSHLDALRGRELTPGYRLLSLLRGRTPTTVCSAALAGEASEESITTLVLGEVKVDGVDDSEVYAAVDRILTTHDLHPAFEGKEPLAALVAVWSGMVLIRSEGALSVVQICKVSSEMTESDALARIVQGDFELRPVSGKSGWDIVEKAGLWDESFQLLNHTLRRRVFQERGKLSREQLMPLLRKYTGVVQNVADEISDGMFDGLPKDWVEDTVTDIIEDLQEQLGK